MGGGKGGVGEKFKMLFSFPSGVYGLAIWGFYSNRIKTEGGKGGAERMGNIVGGRTRVVFSTLARRGKSFTPVSRIETLEERRALLERREETQDARAFAIG